MKRLVLPECAYDFFVFDSRDGETRGPFDTVSEARTEAKKWRKTLKSWQKPCIYVDCRVNERKIKRMLKDNDR